MPIPPEPAVSAVEDIIVTGRRTPAGTYYMNLRYRTANSTGYVAAPPGTRLGRMRFRPVVRITFENPDGAFIPLQFDAAIPAEALEQLLAVMLIAAGEASGLSATN